MKILITGGAGFIGSHVAEYYAKKGDEIIVVDNLSRAKLLNTEIQTPEYNWQYLRKYENVELIKADVTEEKRMEELTNGVDVVLHAAAQTAVTTSIIDPYTDFRSNLFGTVTMLEAARKSKRCSSFLFCSTNKVYGDNVNSVEVGEKEKRYMFIDRKYRNGIPEAFPIDNCEHTPYGCSKLGSDLYVQDYGHLYGLKTGVFRMSCIYGTRQLGVEDQGWVAHFVISTILGKPLTIYGDGKQVRDVLYISDLIQVYDAFLKNERIKAGVYNIGGGSENTISLLELQDILEEITGRRSKTTFSDWRPSDQKVYISNNGKAKKELGWTPKINPYEGVKELSQWVLSHMEIFKGASVKQ